MDRSYDPPGAWTEHYVPRVDFLPRSLLGTPGRLGLTRAPGRLAPGRSLDSDLRLRRDLDVLAGDHGTRLLVTLLEQPEIDELGALGKEARRAGMDWVHFPIPDMWFPSDLGKARKLVTTDRQGALRRRGRGRPLLGWPGAGRDHRGGDAGGEGPGAGGRHRSGAGCSRGGGADLGAGAVRGRLRRGARRQDLAPPAATSRPGRELRAIPRVPWVHQSGPRQRASRMPVNCQRAAGGKKLR